MGKRSVLMDNDESTILIWDGYGRVASGLCVIHCLTVSFAPSLVEQMSFLSSYNESLEWGFFAFALVFSIISAGFGIKKHHNIFILSGFMMGIAILILGRLGEAMSLFEGGEILSIMGGLFLLMSHIYSSSCCRTV